MNRKDEIRQLNQLSPQQVIARAAERLVVCETVADLHRHLADSIFHEIRQNNEAGQPTRLILPVGPTGQYPVLARLLNQARLSLRDCHFFFMDEYCNEAGAVLPSSHPLSFEGIARSLFLDAIAADCRLNPAQVYFPDQSNIDALPAIIASLGGIDTCYGGIGIHGHLAFNEPEPGVRDLPSRKVRLNDYTVTINAIRAQVGGNLASFPRYAYTLGLREILAARCIRLYGRNGIALDWANTVLRLALFGAPGDDYPVTHIRGRDYVIVTDRDTLRSPRHVL
ncbi:MAG: glucosamine-6-phosphate isomerase [Chloroflexi bacterium]|nr:glucosamine-6-phosphate isomerase [Chloroflexota bacterium]